MNKIVVFTHDNWQGLYVNGKLVCEEHAISFQELSRHTPIEDLTVIYTVNGELADSLDKGNSFPNSLQKALDKNK